MPEHGCGLPRALDLPKRGPKYVRWVVQGTNDVDNDIQVYMNFSATTVEPMAERLIS